GSIPYRGVQPGDGDEGGEREREIRRIKNHLTPVNRHAQTLLVQGQTGVGKSVVVRKVLQELENDTTAKSVVVDCREYRTKTAILSKILIEMGIPVPRKGKPVDVMYEKVANLVERHNLVVALDGVDYARLEKEALYTMGGSQARASLWF
ncbi:MAG: AAA family ATPase, partial [Halobacteriaceae archaeon]